MSWLSALVVTGITLIASSVQAAVPVGAVQTFETLPLVADWSSKSVAGAGNSIALATAMDTAMQTNTAASVNTVLVTAAAAAPGTAAQAQWSSVGRFLATRPTGNSYTILMATIQNTTAGNVPSPAIAYDQSSPTAYVGEDAELGGFRTYYSLTGLENSWTQVPELTSSNAGPKLATLNLGTWAAGSLLYLAFVDDNGGPAGDGSFAIDNFQVATTIAAPVITSQPRSTNVVITRSIRLSVTATGLGLTYAWFKDGAQIDSVANPTAAQPTLIINNAQPGDAGAYRVTVANPAGGVVSDIANVLVADDTQAPKYIFASEDPSTLRNFRLQLDEPLCVDAIACDTDATLAFNWVIEEIQNPANVLFVNVVTINGTNVNFETSSDRDPTKAYRIYAGDGGFGGGLSEISDLFRNRIPISQSITAAPSRIFAQGATYTGTQDTYVQSDTPDVINGARVDQIEMDTSNPGTGISQGLLRFDNIFGSGAGQIPSGARIISATLTLNQTDAGSIAEFHRMLITWDQATATWNSFVDGLAVDNVEVSTVIDGSTADGVGAINLTASLQAWSDGQANNGWAMIPTGTDGFRVSPSESGNPPSLSVVFVPVNCVAAPAFVTHPAPTTVSEGSPFTLTASLTGACQATYQWTKDGADIQGANASSYTVASAVGGAGGSAGNYRLRVTNPNGTATSNPALVTVNNDSTPPVLVRAVSTSATTVTLLFSKQLSVVGTYTFSPAVAGVSASFANGANNSTVTVTSAARTLTTPYRLTITGVRDNRALQNFISPNPTITDLTGVSSVLAWAAAGNWNYATNSQDANPGWKTGTFGPEWLVGQQFFGFEPTAAVTNALPIQPDPIKTPLQANDTNVLGAGNSDIFVSAYFVRQVTLPALEANTVFAISHYIDDGAIFYLDGVEIGRFQMPSGAVTFTTRATATGEAGLQTLLFSASAGNHTLAVEVHQGGVSTSDVVFGLEINKVTKPSTLAIVNTQGTNIVSWTADNSWGLTAAQNVNGNYAPVAGNPVRSFRVPPAAQTNHQFYRLHFTP